MIFAELYLTGDGGGYRSRKIQIRLQTLIFVLKVAIKDVDKVGVF